jgi:hypothetical protein
MEVVASIVIFGNYSSWGNSWNVTSIEDSAPLFNVKPARGFASAFFYVVATSSDCVRPSFKALAASQPTRPIDKSATII